MSIADNFKPYPAAATETVWKAAKSETLRDFDAEKARLPKA